MLGGPGSFMAFDPSPNKPNSGPINMSELQPLISRRTLFPHAASNSAMGVSNSPCHSTCNDVPQTPRPSLLASRRYYPPKMEALLTSDGNVNDADCGEDRFSAEVSEQLPCAVPERPSPGQSPLGCGSHKVSSSSRPIQVSEPSGPPSPASAFYRASEGLSMTPSYTSGPGRPRDLPMFAAAAISAPSPGSPSVHGLRSPSMSVAGSVAAAGIGYQLVSPVQVDADAVEPGGNTSPVKTPTRRLHGGAGGGGGVTAAPVLILAAGSELGERQPSCSGYQPPPASMGEAIEGLQPRRSSIMAWSTVEASATVRPVASGLISGNSCSSSTFFSSATTTSTTSSTSPAGVTKPPLAGPRASIGFSRRPEDLPAAPTPAHSRSLAGSTSTTPTSSQSSGPALHSHPPPPRFVSQCSIGLSRRPEDLPAAPSPSASRSLGGCAMSIRSGASTPASPGGSCGGWRPVHDNVLQLAGQSRQLGTGGGANSAHADNSDLPFPAHPPAGQTYPTPPSPRYTRRPQEDGPLSPTRAGGSFSMGTTAAAADLATFQRGPPLIIGSSSAPVRSSQAAPPSPRASIGFSRRPEDLPAAPTPSHSRSLAGSTSTTPTSSQSSGPALHSHPPPPRLVSQCSIGLSRRPEDLPAAPSPSASRSLTTQGKGPLPGPGGRCSDNELVAPGTPSSPFSSQFGGATGGGAASSCRWVARPLESSASSSPGIQRSSIHNIAASATSGRVTSPIPSLTSCATDVYEAEGGTGGGTPGVGTREGCPSPPLGVSRRPEDMPAAPSPTASRSLRPDSSRAVFRCHERPGGAGLRPGRPPTASGMAPAPPQPVPPPGAVESSMGIRRASSLLFAPPPHPPPGIAVGKLCDDGATGDDMVVVIKGSELDCVD